MTPAPRRLRLGGVCGPDQSPDGLRSLAPIIHGLAEVC